MSVQNLSSLYLWYDYGLSKQQSNPFYSDIRNTQIDTLKAFHILSLKGYQDLDMW